MENDVSYSTRKMTRIYAALGGNSKNLLQGLVFFDFFLNRDCIIVGSIKNALYSVEHPVAHVQKMVIDCYDLYMFHGMFHGV